MALGDHDVVEFLLQGSEVSHLDRGNQGKGGIVADYGVVRAEWLSPEYESEPEHDGFRSAEINRQKQFSSLPINLAANCSQAI
jgi:hypothetical protein